MGRRSWLLAAFAVAAASWPVGALAQGNGSGGAGTKPQFYRAPTTAAANLPFSDAARVGRLLYVNNQIGNIPGEPQVVKGGLASELKQAMANVQAIVKANGLEMDDVFRCTISLADMSQWAELNRLWPTYFTPGRLPVRNVIGVTALPLGGRVGVECTADAR